MEKSKAGTEDKGTVTQAGLTEEVTFKQSPEEERSSHRDEWG